MTKEEFTKVFCPNLTDQQKIDEGYDAYTDFKNALEEFLKPWGTK